MKSATIKVQVVFKKMVNSTQNNSFVVRIPMKDGTGAGLRARWGGGGGEDNALFLNCLSCDTMAVNNDNNNNKNNNK